MRQCIQPSTIRRLAHLSRFLRDDWLLARNERNLYSLTESTRVCIVIYP